MTDEIKEKKIDESWKEAVKKEGQEAEKKDGAEAQVPDITFSNFVTSLSLQALISLGEIENPLTNKKEKNLLQAKFLIDTLDMINEKTMGNLSQDEKNLIETVVYEMKMKFVQEAKGGQDDRQGTA